REKAEVEFDEGGDCVRGTGFTQDITERKHAEQEIQDLAKFPSENPNPVIRVSSDGTILYTNAASSLVLKTWGCRVGERMPEDCCKRVDEVFRTGKICNFEFNCHNELILLMTLSPVIDGGYANIYGLDITRRKQVERELVGLNEELEQRVTDRTSMLIEAHKQLLEDVEERRRLEREIIGVSEREKRLVGQELHDSVGQQLVGAGFVAQVLSNDLLDKLPDKAIKASEMVDLIKVALEQTRSIAHGLHPVDLDSGNLTAALAELADDTRRVFNVPCVFKFDESIEIGDVEVAGNLYRIAQESITNAVKHGRASEINMSFVSNSKEATLIIKDDGCGISENIDRSKGIGLRIMKYRAEMIGGRLDIQRCRKNGTVVTCKFSVKRDAKPNGADYETGKTPDEG
ncbi:ATP-binding protein, partial [Planctomycetota bacterium]